VQLLPWYVEWGHLLAKVLPIVAFIAWCLWGVDWRKTWPVLAEGGWVPLVLVGLMAGVVWALVFPATAILFGFIPVPNGLWQIGAAGLLICLAFTCGWLQGLLRWYPPEISFDPPAAAHDHEHSAH
jgi:hypothetical protein